MKKAFCVITLEALTDLLGLSQHDINIVDIIADPSTSKAELILEGKGLPHCCTSEAVRVVFKYDVPTNNNPQIYAFEERPWK